MVDSGSAPTDPSNANGDGSDQGATARDTSTKSRRSRLPLWAAAVLLPLVVAAFVQLEAVQTVEGHLIEGLPWNVGKWDVIADIFSPAWAIAIIVLAALNRRLLDRFDPDPDFSPKSALGRYFGTETWVRRSTWIASGGAVLLVVLSYTREWEKFGETPNAFWFVLVLLGTLAMLMVPWLWVRLDLEKAARQAMRESRAVATVYRYLLEPDDAGHARWAQLVALAALTSLAAWIALGQLDALLRGMHLTNNVSYGVAALSDVAQLDLSRKPAEVADVVTTWLTYSSGLGSQFATARSVLGQYLLIDSIVLMPSYVILIGVLLIKARTASPPDLVGRPRRSYDLLITAGMSTLIIVAIADLVENLFTWIVVSSIWEGASVTDWSVRLMWAGSLVRTMGLVLLAAGTVVILGLRRQRFGGVAQSLIAVRGESARHGPAADVRPDAPRPMAIGRTHRSGRSPRSRVRDDSRRGSTRGSAPGRRDRPGHRLCRPDRRDHGLRLPDWTSSRHPRRDDLGSVAVWPPASRVGLRPRRPADYRASS